MKKLVLTMFALIMGIAVNVSDAKAMPIDMPVPGTDYITVGVVDWAWAAPCAPMAPSCGIVDLSYQGGQGWKLPTIAEMTAAVTNAGGSVGWAALFGTANDFKCASRYFSTAHTHCDYSNATASYIYNLDGGQAPNSAEETFVMRVATIPVPAAIIMLISGLGGLGLIGRRRKNQV